jgi:cytochrome c556
MNKNLVNVIVLGMVIVLTGMLVCGCGGKPPEQKRQEGMLERMKPKKDDRLSALMTRGWDNLSYIVYGFMSYDNEKIKTGTTNIVAMSPYMAQRIGPQYMEYKREWKEQCEQQKEIAIALKQHFEEMKFEEALNSLNELIGVCMDCHKVYRKHLLRPEFE